MAKPRKVIRTKTLYKKNRLPPQLVGAILFLLLIFFIVIVGFVLMHEMTKRFGEDIDNNNIVVEESSVPAEEYPPIIEEEVIEEIVDISKVGYISSQTLASGRSVVEEELQNLVLDGFTAVAFELKPENGMLVYQTDVSQALSYGALEDLEVIDDYLFLDEIVAIANENEITPVAYLSALRDPVSGHVQFDTGYAYSSYTTTNWLDNTVSAGGKAWLNPYMENTQEYISNLVVEMYDAGFTTIFLNNVIFPTQNTGMMNTIINTPSKEQILTDFVEIIADAVPEANVFRVEDLTFTATIEEYLGSDISTTNYNTVLSRCETENIAVSMSLENIANRKEQIILRENLSVDNTADSVEIFKELLEKAITTLGTDITVVVTTEDFEEVKSVLEEFAVVSYVITN